MARRPLGDLSPDLTRVGAGVSRAWRSDGAQAGPSPSAQMVGLSSRFVSWTFDTVAGSKLFLPVRDRRYLLVQNNFGTDLRLNLDLDASATLGLRIPPNAIFEWFAVVPSNALHFWAAAAGGKFLVQEA